MTVEPNGQTRLHYRPNNLAAHARLVEETERLLKHLGFWVVMTYGDYPARRTLDLQGRLLAVHLRDNNTRNTTHQCGTLCFGRDPSESVLDPFCRAHDVENLFVVDASFFPSSAAVNPGLTIAAQALRVADHIKDVDL